METALLDSHTLEYVSAGTGEPVLLLSGLGSDAWMWDAQVKDLSRVYRCISVNHRGVGASTCPPDEKYTLEALADDAAALLNSLAVERAHIVGASMGGVIAQIFAMRHPGRILTLSLHSTWAKTPALLRLHLQQQIALLEHMNVTDVQMSIADRIWSEHTLNHRMKVIEEFRAQREANASVVPNEVYAWQATECLDLDLLGPEYKISVPVLITHGADDLLIGPELSDEIALAIPQAEAVVFPRSGHAPSLEWTELFNSVQISFLNRHREGSA